MKIQSTANNLSNPFEGSGNLTRVTSPSYGAINNDQVNVSDLEGYNCCEEIRSQDLLNNTTNYCLCSSVISGFPTFITTIINAALIGSPCSDNSYFQGLSGGAVTITLLNLICLCYLKYKPKEPYLIHVKNEGSIKFVSKINRSAACNLDALILGLSVLLIVNIAMTILPSFTCTRDN